MEQNNADLTAYVSCYETCFTESANFSEAEICAAGAVDSTCETEKAACSAVIF